MANLSMREKVLLSVLFILVFGFVYYKYVASPQIIKLETSLSVLNNNKRALADIKEKGHNLESIKKQYSDLNTQFEQYKKSIPDNTKIPEIIMQIKDMTDSSGCIGGRLIFGAPAIKSGDNTNNTNAQGNKNTNIQSSVPQLVVIPLTYDLNGDNNSIITFLGKIESSSRKMIVDKILVSKDDKTGKLTANLGINCFYLKKNGPLDPIEYPFLNNNYGKADIFN